MIQRTARERLLFEARDAAADVDSLEGIRGHTATLERSEDGPARIVRVWHDGTVVSWAFSLEPGEARPPFYPADVPFMPELRCRITWDDDSGLVVQWREDLGSEGQAQFSENLQSFRERFEQLTGQPLGAGARLSKEQAAEAIASLPFPGLKDAAAARVAEIVAFHEDAGWERTSETTSGPVEKVRLKRGDVQRVLIATTFGASTIVLGEGGSGADEPASVRSPGSRAGLRLRWDG